MTRIYLIRHGETAWNREKVFRGHADVGLSERGRLQAEALVQAFEDRAIDALYSSPLPRSLQTAMPLAKHFNLELRKEPGLIDIQFGLWQGLSQEAVRKEYAKLYELWMLHPYRVRFPEGESLEDVRKRAVDAVDALVSKHPGKSVIVVSHRVVNKVLICALLGLGNDRFWMIRQDTGALNLFGFRANEKILYLLNDTCHLRGVGGSDKEVDFQVIKGPYSGWRVSNTKGQKKKRFLLDREEGYKLPWEFGAKRMIDLHVHSSMSNGTYSPLDVVNYARSRGLEAIAITDHDSIEGNELAIAD